MTTVGTADVVLIRENPDGSADYQFNLPKEALDALTRLGILTAIKAGIEEGNNLNPEEPVKHEWVGLTREEMFECGGGMLNMDEERLCKYIEAKLKEKNT